MTVCLAPLRRRVRTLQRPTYGAVGGLDFLVGAGVLQALVTRFGIQFFLGRVVTFVSAVPTNRIVNRAATFSARERAPCDLFNEWIRYSGANRAGAR